MTFLLGVGVGVALAWLHRHVAWGWPDTVVERWHSRERQQVLIKRYDQEEGDRG